MNKLPESEFWPKIEPVLHEIEYRLLEKNVLNPECVKLQDRTLYDAYYILINILNQKMYELQRRERMDMNDCINMETSANNDLIKLIKIYTGIDINTIKV